MFARKSHDCPACAAKDQTIAALADQIDWLRLHMGTPLLKRPSEQSAVPEVGMVVDRSPFFSEEEEDVREMYESGDIGQVELERALAQIQAFSTDVELHTS